MADNIRKPIPKNQRDISISKQDAFLDSNPNDAVTPLPQFVNPNTPPQNTSYRARQISVKDDTTRPFTVGIQDIDESINYYFENVIRPQVYQNGTMIDIPIIYGNPERWKAVQKDGYYRDKNAKIMAPLIMFRRTGMEKNRSIGNKLDANNPINYAVASVGYQKNDTYSNFDILNNRKPVESYQVVVIPDYVTLTYDCVIWTYYIEQMNKIVESINYASDSYWGDPARFKFLARIDSFTNNETLNQGEERLIKTNFSISLNGYIVPDSINKNLPSANKIYSKGKVTVNTELEVTPGAPLRSSGASGAAAPPAPSFDADYQAILDYATTQGYTLPSDDQQILQNQLVVDLKDAGVWSDFDLFYVFATDGDSDFASINWVNPNNFECDEYNSPTFTTNLGFTGDGSSAYLDTNFNIDTDAVNYDPSNEDGSDFVYVDETGGDGAIFGSDVNAASTNRFRLNNTGTFGNVMNTGGVSVPSSMQGDAFWYRERIGSFDQQYYKNGVSYQTVTSNGNQTQSTTRKILADFEKCDNTVSLYGCGSSLGSTLQSDLYDAWNTYFTSI